MKSLGAVAGAIASIALAGCVADTPANDQWLLEVWDTGYAQADRQLPTAPGLLPPARVTRPTLADDSDEPERTMAIMQAALGEDSTRALSLPKQQAQNSRSNEGNAPQPARREGPDPVTLPPAEPNSLSPAAPPVDTEWSDEMPRSDWAADQVLAADDQLGIAETAWTPLRRSSVSASP